VQVDTNAKRWQITFGFENRLESGDYGVLLALAETGEDLELAVHMDVIETALVFRSIRTTDHPAAHGLVYQPAVVDVVSLGQKDSACP
jgi:hypothetical protein